VSNIKVGILAANDQLGNGSSTGQANYGTGAQIKKHKGEEK